MAQLPNETDDEHDADGAEAPPHAPLVSGKTAVILVGLIGVLGAASALLYRYDQTRLPREFWGFESPRIFVDAETVTAVLIKPEAPGVAEKKPYYDDLFMVDENRYVVVKKIDISKREDLEGLRHALSNYRSFDSGRKQWKEPEWRFGLSFSNFHPQSGVTFTASIVFDSECRLGRPQSVQKTISATPISASLLAFFETLFPEAVDMPKVTPQEQMVNPLPPEPAQAVGANGLVMPADKDVVTLGAKPGEAASTVPNSGTRVPTVVPNLDLPPVLQQATQPNVLSIPGASPGQSTPAVGGFRFGGGNLPGNTPMAPPSNPAPDFLTPRSVVVPPLDNKPGGT